MKRTDVVLPDFTRVVWSSAQAQSVWEPRISAVSNYVMDMEREACLRGRVALQFFSPENLPGITRWAASRGLMALALNPTVAAGSYSSTPKEYVSGQPWTIRVAICLPMLATTFFNAWKSGDNTAIGSALGYPPCCIDFFNRIWVDDKFLDTTWPMAVKQWNHAPTMIEVSGPSECNILLRWLGVRAVPHLPCSFDCKRTTEFSKTFLDVSREPYQWLMEMLSWPVEWSALHGIAEIKTPILKIMSRTDHTNDKYTVRRVGWKYPAEGARGLVFPFRSQSEQEPLLWTDNGFESLEAMNDAHRVILDISKKDVSSIHDLGCGNGYLLSKFDKIFPKTVRLVGVDIETKKWVGGRAIQLHYNLTQHYVGQDERPALGLLSINRITELRKEIFKVLSQFKFILVYSYDGVCCYVEEGWTKIEERVNGSTRAILYERNG